MCKYIFAVPSSQSDYNLLKEATKETIQNDNSYDNTWHVAVQSMRHRDQDQENYHSKANGFVAVAVRNT